MSCRHHLGNFGLNTTCYFGCKAGFTLMGDSARRCRPSGQWTGGTPACRGNRKGACSSAAAFRLAATLIVTLPVEIPSCPTTTTHVSSPMKATLIPLGGNVPQACHLSPCYVTNKCPGLKDTKEETFANVPVCESNKFAQHETNYKNCEITSCSSMNDVIV